MEREIITSILASSVGLAGVLLIFVGFVYSRVETFERAEKAKKYRLVARVGAIPFLLAVSSAWLCLEWLVGPSACLYNNAVLFFKMCLVLTGLYGTVALAFYL